LGRLSVDSVDDDDVSVPERRLARQPEVAEKPQSRANCGEMSGCGVGHSTRDEKLESLTSGRAKAT
jgi:hypothetical protein